MIKWTTPRLKCNIPSDIPLDYVLLTLKQGGIVIEKNISADQIEDGTFYITLSQEETSLFNLGLSISAQVNIMSGTTRLASKILELTATKNLHDEEIGPHEETILDITQNGIYTVKSYDKVNVNVDCEKPTGTLEITENGTYDVTQYASVDVNVNQKTKYVIYDVICTEENIDTDFGGVWFEGIVADLSKHYKVDFKGKTYSLDYRVPASTTAYMSCSQAELNTCENAVLVNFTRRLDTNKWFYHLSYNQYILPSVNDRILIYYED